MRTTPCCLLVLVALAAPACAFNGHRVVEGPLRVVIDEVGPATEYDRPVGVTVTATNLGDAPLDVELEMAGLVDQWRPVGETKRRVQLAGRGEAKVTFQIAGGQGAYSALYPVHVYARFAVGGKRLVAHAVQVFDCRFARKATGAGQAAETKPLRLGPNRALSLYATKRQRVAWCYYDEPMVYMPQGWQGGLQPCRGNFGRSGLVTRGTPKAAIGMHPPWVPGGGTIFAEYPVVLPKVKPIKLTFANAIRDSSATEPLSDGVTFRVWVGDEKLFERHTDSKVWVDGEADLSEYAGRQVLLRLESHPGPKRDTTCDSSYWAEPTLVSGKPHRQVTEADREALRRRARAAVKRRRRGAEDEVVYWLGKDSDSPVFAAVLGDHGLFDGCLAFGVGDKCVTFDGLRVTVMDQPVGQWPTGIVQTNLRCSRGTSGFSMGHSLEMDGEKGELLVGIQPERPGLRIRLGFAHEQMRRRRVRHRGGPASEWRMTDIALGPADQTAPRVYYGHGYCIEEPEAFRAGFGGHNLSTSHVGFDFERGVSLLTASDTPPSYLSVDPASRTYALHTHMSSTLTFVAGTKGAFDCAVKYQGLFDKKPAGGFARKAGRFVFDIWGGRYSEIAYTMQEMIDYGCTDSLLTVHAWQRWGYDYRLPDIWPPSPHLGTAEDMRKIGEVCRRHDIPWGLHDNYIDFYPDATDYTYDHVCFTPGGAPIKAWINTGRDAQSYRWRPDAFEPFVKRNLKLIKEAVAPSHYFIDVFTSAGCFDFYDKDGRFHPSTETRKCWGETFAWIRDYLGGNAPTTSEAGHDQLIGYLDGADCQHLQLTNGTRPPGLRYWFCIRLPHKDWERVPWYDAVLHDKFSLHGVGYSGRYQGGRPRKLHGIASDDYISDEILLGHALMIDGGGFGRAAVRKYWLAQDFVRSIALDTIAGVEFFEDDIHRQIVTWRSGAKVYVNRGESDWAVAGRVLPQYGYCVKHGAIESSIERIDGIIAEQSQAPGRWYVNARTADPDRRLAFRPEAERVEDLGAGKFKLLVKWHAQQPAAKDLHVFIHFNSDRASRGDKIAFQGGHGAVRTSQWRGEIVTGDGREVSVPGEYGAGEYEITIGLWDPSSGRRYPMHGDDDGSTRYRLGTLVVDGEGAEVTNVRLVKAKPKPEPATRLNVDKKPIDFGPCITDGACRIEAKDAKVVVTPLPEQPPFALSLRLDRLGLAGRQAKSLRSLSRDGAAVRAVDFEQGPGVVRLRTRLGEFGYVMEF